MTREAARPGLPGTGSVDASRRLSVAYGVKTYVGARPRLFLPTARLRGHGVLAGSAVEVCIEGYPRSANSFSVAAFEMAQGRRTLIAHHTHAPANVLAAVEAGLPTIVLIRRPPDAILEFLLLRPKLSVAQAVRGYLRFYGPLIPVFDRIVVGRFDEVTTDLGRVIRRVNERFGTAFREFEHTEESVRACFDAMDRYWTSRVGEGMELELRVGRPSKLREELKRSLRCAYDIPHLARLRERADGIYRTFSAQSLGHEP